ncbi:DUF4387 domain-containing protein [Alloprevotella rava]|jgi:hypothetical protein|uniref:DUF4387 domain-containing protein n=1 Tax=Alloprevotella rava TaxID=671218 RepID=A0A7W5UEI7_9BACT|nr:DUF4387 domain-containing protein [Alloprevotella rava]MBB3702603.1 hypothetical protein [Alloprevotella rava]
MKLIDIASVIRSKNSGPYELTFDVIFKDFETYGKVKAAQAVSKEKFCALYGIPETDVFHLVYFDPAKAVKITIRRPIPSGALGETDVYGAQQHAPLMGMEIEI